MQAERQSPAESFDAIVIGGGHNGLTAAAYLAKKSKKIIVLEQAAHLGGLAHGREFHPNIRASGYLHDTSAVRSRVISELNLQKYGLKFQRVPASVFIPSQSGPGLYLHHNPDDAEAEISRLSARDAVQYRKFRRYIRRIRPFVEDLFDSQAPSIYGISAGAAWDLLRRAVGLRMLGSKDMMELLRVGPMCAADWLNEWFESDLLKAALAGPAVFGNYAGPWSPSTNANLIVYECMARFEILGGPQALVNALVKACEQFRVELRVQARVTRIITEQNRAIGVALDNGSVIYAKQVLSTCDPKQTLLGLVAPTDLDARSEQRTMQLRNRGTTAKIHFALSRPPEFSGRPGFHPEFIRCVDSLDDIEKAFDPVKYGEIPARPVLDIQVQRATSANADHYAVSVLVHFVPYHLRGGWNELRKEELLCAVMNRIKEYSPDFEQSIIATDVMTPADIEQNLLITAGNLFHIEHAPDQMLMRPTPESAQYRSPIPGLFLGGSGSHPGGGITCAPGSLAAKAMLADA